MQRLNSSNNLDGRDIRLVLGSPAIKAGISFFHMQHMHLIDMTWNISSVRQIEGRVSRYCSHVEITDAVTKATGLKRQVIIRSYYLVRPKVDGLERPTIDSIIMDIVKGKAEGTTKGEMMLQNVAFDHWLFRDLRATNHEKDVRTDPTTGTNSPVFFEDFKLKGPKNKMKDPCDPDRKIVDDEKCRPNEYEYTLNFERKKETHRCCTKSKDKAKAAQMLHETILAKRKGKLSKKQTSPKGKGKATKKRSPSPKGVTKRAYSNSDSDVEIMETPTQRMYGNRLTVLTREQRDAVELNPTVNAARDFLSGASAASSSRNTREKAQTAIEAIELMNSL
jgi:hypothetical protein